MKFRRALYLKSAARRPVIPLCAKKEKSSVDKERCIQYNIHLTQRESLSISLHYRPVCLRWRNALAGARRQRYFIFFLRSARNIDRALRWKFFALAARALYSNYWCLNSCDESLRVEGYIVCVYFEYMSVEERAKIYNRGFVCVCVYVTLDFGTMDFRYMGNSA